MALDNADVKMLELGAASGSVTVWTTGLSLDEVVAVATSLRTNSGGAGWSADALPDPRAWTLLDQSWYSGAAARTLRQVAPEGDTALEMSIWTGVPFALIGPEMFGWQMSLGQVGDAPALLFESVGTSAITWSPSPGVVVVLGSYGPIDALFEIAQSVTEVDLATWEAASTFDPPPYDGCDSMFC